MDSAQKPSRPNKMAFIKDELFIERQDCNGDIETVEQMRNRKRYMHISEVYAKETGQACHDEDGQYDSAYTSWLENKYDEMNEVRQFAINSLEVLITKMGKY